MDEQTLLMKALHLSLTARGANVLKVGSAKMTSTLDGNIASQNKQRFPEYKKWSDASAINEFVIVTVKSLF